jgi:hypothetical protein
MADEAKEEPKKSESGPGLLSIALVSVGAVVVGGLLLDALRARRTYGNGPAALPPVESDPWGFVG